MAGPRAADRARGPEAAWPLAGIELAVFDKDGTLIDFRRMWGGWVADLAVRLSEALGRPADAIVEAVMGVDLATGAILPHGGIAATPMVRLRERLEAAIAAGGTGRVEARRAVAAAWRHPDPVTLARPLADLPALLGALRAAGLRIAIATSDDRGPTLRTIRHLGLDDLVDAVACADDGHPVKPAPDAVLVLCAELGIPPERAAVVGDSPADVAMGRAAGAGLVVGVLTGVGDRATLEATADVVLDSVVDLLPLDRPGPAR